MFIFLIILQDDLDIPNEPEIQLQNSSIKSTIDVKRSKSPSSPMPYHAVELQTETPPTKRRKFRDNTNTNVDKTVSNALSGKDSENKISDNQTIPGSDPVEIIPLMPNLKLEMPEYLEQDGSSCSYEEQRIGDSSLNKIGIEDTPSNTPDHDQKPDITQTFYTSTQSISDSLDSKHQPADVGKHFYYYAKIFLLQYSFLVFKFGTNVIFFLYFVIICCSFSH